MLFHGFIRKCEGQVSLYLSRFFFFFFFLGQWGWGGGGGRVVVDIWSPYLGKWQLQEQLYPVLPAHAKFPNAYRDAMGETISGFLDVSPYSSFVSSPIVTFCMRGQKRIGLTRFSSSSARLDGWLYINYTCESLATRITRFHTRPDDDAQC